MEKFKAIRLNGVTYYNVGCSKTVNMTYSANVTENNYSEVEDIDCFTYINGFNNVDEFEKIVKDYIATKVIDTDVCNSLNGLIPNDDVVKVCNMLHKQKSNREIEILVDLQSVDIGLYEIEGTVELSSVEDSFIIHIENGLNNGRLIIG